MDYLNKFLEPLNVAALDNLPGLKFIEEKYKLKPSLSLLAISAAMLVLTPILGVYAFTTGIFCFLVPAFLSFLALESKEKADDIKYLTYWVVFSLVEISSPIIGLLFSNFFFMLIRIVLSILLLHPSF